MYVAINTHLYIHTHIYNCKYNSIEYNLAFAANGTRVILHQTLCACAPAASNSHT